VKSRQDQHAVFNSFGNTVRAGTLRYDATVGDDGQSAVIRPMPIRKQLLHGYISINDSVSVGSLLSRRFLGPAATDKTIMITPQYRFSGVTVIFFVSINAEKLSK
jgi:hypothetical protein